MRESILGKYALMSEEQLQRMEYEKIKAYSEEYAEDATPEQLKSLLNSFKEDSNEI